MYRALITGIFGFVMLALSACAIQLAPAYDKQIVEGLQASSEAALVHYANVSQGAKASDFPKQEEEYNKLIGKLDAIRVLSQSRYVPAFPTRGLFRRFNPTANVAASETNQAPSTTAIAEMVNTLTALRDKHRDDGLTKGFVKASKNQFETFLDQAMTYERALER